MKFCPRFRPRAGLVGVLVLLWGCQMSLPGTGPARLDVLGGQITVAAPFGYCISPETANLTDETAVVLIGRCLDGTKSDAALVTVSIGGNGSAAVLAVGGAALAAFFTSAPGRATLARSGRPGDVSVVKVSMSGEDFLLFLNDRISGTYWRAITGLSGRLVTVSVAGTAEVPLTPERARVILDSTLAAMRRANP